MSAYIAIDLGGSSCRVSLGHTDRRLDIIEVHRFPNNPIKVGNHLCWDFPTILEGIKTGIRKAAKMRKDIESIGIDSWGVDFGLLDKEGKLIGYPICYRDNYTNGIPEEVFSIIDEKKLYKQSGTQAMPINTIFQLYALKKEGVLEEAQNLLFIPDLISYYLCGEIKNEFTMATTSGLLNIKTYEWNWNVIKKLGLPEHLFGDIIFPYEDEYGCLTKEAAKELGLSTKVKVVAVGSHDTASAQHSIVYDGYDKEVSAFLSSGTWSLLGIELDEPITTEAARKAGFTNEGSTYGNICFLKNITGLWIFNQLVKKWEAEGHKIDYSELLLNAAKTKIGSYINVNDPIFNNPMDMEVAIITECLMNNQVVPSSQGEFVKVVLQSLAREYKETIDQLNSILDRPIEYLHVVGGGTQNWLLNYLIEQELDIEVIVDGYPEATTFGNLLVQLP